MGLTDVMAQPDPMHRAANEIESVGHHVPSHSRESSTSSSVGSSCSHGIIANSAQSLSSMTLYSDLPRDVDLENRLEKTRLELEQSRAECGRLAQIRDDVEAEVRELTASLFQEAHVMVNAANVKAAASEKALKEARMQVEVLQAEVEALKTLVLTSTPSQPNAHLHPQLASSQSSGNIHLQNASSSPSNKSSGALKMFTRHRRGASDCDMKYHHVQQHGGDSSPSLLSSSPENVTRGSSSDTLATPFPADDGQGEIDPVLYSELQSWRQSPTLEQGSSPLMKRLFVEDADRCLDFPQRELADRVVRAVRDNAIYIEELPNQTTCQCALLATERPCRYRIKLGDGVDNQWYTISSLCRNRITAVCDTLTYLRYIQLGLVKSSVDDIYWEVIRLRKRMTLARLGLS